jgi:membrane-associated phospholipid phosphatase
MIPYSSLREISIDILLFPKTRSHPMRHRFLLSLLLTIICESSLFAQNTYNFSQFGNETWSFIKQPTKWEGSDWLKLGLMGAGTFLVMQADQPIRDGVLKDQRYYKSVPIEAGRIWGESYVIPIVAGGFGLHGFLTDNSSTKKIGFEVAQAVIYSAAITQILSKSVGRARPNQNKGAFFYQPFTFLGEDFHSLPGGHTTAAFVLSTVLSRNAHSGFLKGLAYVPAVLTLVSRVYQDYHWASDDLLGAAIGYFVAEWVVNQHEQKENRIEMSSVYPFTIRISIN